MDSWIRSLSRTVVKLGIFAVPFLPLVVVPWLLYPYVTGRAFFFRSLVEVVLAAWIVLQLRDERYRLRPSPLLWALIGFAAVVGLADLVGVEPLRSFWGDLSRMDGYLALLHWLAFFVVAGTFLAAERAGERFLATSVLASALVCVWALVELVQNVAAGQPRQRLEAGFGNPTFLATYVLLQVFLAAYLISRKGEKARRDGRRLDSLWGWPARSLVLVQLVVLFLTGTRGALLGLVVGTSVAILLVATLSRVPGAARTGAREAIGAILIVVVGFFALEIGADRALPDGSGNAPATTAAAPAGAAGATGGTTPPVASDPGPPGSLDRLAGRLARPLGRMARIGTGTSVQVRLALWETAWEGFRERPLRGWGQEVFDVVAERYRVSTQPTDEIADRPHNVVLGWLVAAGLPGGIAYLAILVTAGWVVWRPATAAEGDARFVRYDGITARCVLTGLLCADLVAGLFLFDTVTSYAVFFSVLAYLHGRSGSTGAAGRAGRPPRRLQGTAAPTPARDWTTAIVAPLVLVAAAWTVWQVNLVPLRAAFLARSATLLAPVDPEESLRRFDRALALETFGESTIRQQLILAATDLSLARTPAPVVEDFQAFAARHWTEELERRPERARLHAYMGNLRLSRGEPGPALEHLSRAVEISSRDPSHRFRLADAYRMAGEPGLALAEARTGFDLDPTRASSRRRYAAAALHAGRERLARELLLSVDGTIAVDDPHVLRAYIDTGRAEEMADAWRARVREDPADLRLRRSLADFLRMAGRDREAATQYRTLEALARIQSR